MKVSARVDYAILAVFELALHTAGKRVQAKEISGKQQVPLRFLEQILIQLKKAGLVKSIRGASGGYVLAKASAQISLLAVVEAIEGEFSLRDRRLQANSTVLSVWREIEEEVLNRLRSVTIQDLVRRKIKEDRVIVYHI